MVWRHSSTSMVSRTASPTLRMALCSSMFQWIGRRPFASSFPVAPAWTESKGWYCIKVRQRGHLLLTPWISSCWSPSSMAIRHRGWLSHQVSNARIGWTPAGPFLSILGRLSTWRVISRADGLPIGNPWLIGSCLLQNSIWRPLTWYMCADSPICCDANGAIIARLLSPIAFFQTLQTSRGRPQLLLRPWRLDQPGLTDNISDTSCRQLSVAITEGYIKFIRSLCNLYDDRSVDADIEVSFARQSGHRPLQRGISYGIVDAYPDSLQPPLLRLYGWVSQGRALVYQIDNTPATRVFFLALHQI